MAKNTYSKEERKTQFLATGLKLARKNGIAKVSVAAVAAEHKVTAPLVFHIFGSRDKLQAAIKREAKKQGVALAEPKAVASAPKRKRSITEVKAIKDKAAPVANRPKVAAPAKVAAKKPKVAAPAKVVKKVAAKKPKVAAPAKVAKKPKVAAPAKVAAPKVKYPTQPTPVNLAMNANPTNTL